MQALDHTEIRDAELHNCWKSIGVAGGDKSCPALRDHAHCRNCPTYAAAATTLLDRAVSDETAGASSSHYAAAVKAERPKDRSALLFRLGDEWFALPTRVVDEVVEPRPIHVLPHRRSPVVLGIANVRGELLVSLSLGRLLGMKGDDSATPSRTRRFMVLRSSVGRLLVAVDEVQIAHRYHDGEILPPPATLSRSETSFTQGLLALDGRMIGVIDEARLMDALDRNIA